MACNNKAGGMGRQWVAGSPGTGGNGRYKRRQHETGARGGAPEPAGNGKVVEVNCGRYGNGRQNGNAGTTQAGNWSRRSRTGKAASQVVGRQVR